MGDPFVDQTEGLIALDTSDVADSEVAERVRTVEQLSKDKYQPFVTIRLQERATPLFDAIQKNNLPLFS